MLGPQAQGCCWIIIIKRITDCHKGKASGVEFVRFLLVTAHFGIYLGHHRALRTNTNKEYAQKRGTETSTIVSPQDHQNSPSLTCES